MGRKGEIKMRASENKTYDMVYIGVFAVLMVICTWISIPMAVPFTLQTFAVFFSVGMLGGKKGTIVILVYILLGIIGLPVFSGFMGGIGKLLGNTGGYIIGFVFSSLAMWGMERLVGRKTWALGISMVLGLIICYVFGTAWFMAVYAENAGTVGLMTVLGWCVFPFIVPDLIKIALALALSGRLRHFLHQP